MEGLKNRQTVLHQCKPEAMHSTVRQKCIFTLYAKPGQTSRQTLHLRQKDKHIKSDYS